MSLSSFFSVSALLPVPCFVPLFNHYLFSCLFSPPKWSCRDWWRPFVAVCMCVCVCVCMLLLNKNFLCQQVHTASLWWAVSFSFSLFLTLVRPPSLPVLLSSPFLPLIFSLTLLCVSLSLSLALPTLSCPIALAHSLSLSAECSGSVSQRIHCHSSSPGSAPSGPASLPSLCVCVCVCVFCLAGMCARQA